MKAKIAELLDRIGFTFIMRNINRRKIPIVLFHRVSDDVDNLWPPLQIGAFSLLMDELQRNYQIIPLSNLDKVGPQSKEKPFLVISFDDGFADFYRNVYPLIQEKGITVNHNIITSCLETGLPPWTSLLHAYLRYCAQMNTSEISWEVKGRTITFELAKGQIPDYYNKIYKFLISGDFNVVEGFINQCVKPAIEELELPDMMTKAQVKEISSNGVEIGSHTHSHALLGRIQDDDQIKAELIKSKRILEELTGNEINTIAFPNGIYNRKTLCLSANVGYKNALTTESHLYLKSDKNDHSIRLIPRVSIYSNNIHINKLKISGLLK